jgi:hypothetical protein
MMISTRDQGVRVAFYSNAEHRIVEVRGPSQCN